ncbi:high affinity immunoglobulin gamma Fc receptor I-like isoform X2 [Onychostoma macrolepis]|uniref:high affinity immunoglobulin gamma Fc receptor I-like isoform X2 n=1 Tax=Onychostoma macrolepis TaxID=369639 RepID=UPI00272CFCBE|nr:high affinity immunoglobulin gamma Fc receptor I-like isoform X2 [Onychostoma macrolepis]
MELCALLLMLLLLSLALSGYTQQDLPRASVTADPDRVVFTGETISLKCAIESSYSDWRFHWSKYSSAFTAGEKYISAETLTIEGVSESDQDKYWCWGERESRPMKSQKSEAVLVRVEDRAQAVLKISQSWLTEGDSVTLGCAVRSSSRGWTFSWFRDDHELLSDSSRGAEGSYTLSPAAVKHTGVYSCRAERGAYFTEYSYTQLLWVTSRRPRASPIISPSRSQHFLSDSLSLSCEDQRSSGWRLRRYGMTLEDCSSSDWGSETGSTCRISSLKTSDTGVYWCQSESGEKSQPVNITVHDVDVILGSSVYPLNEGDPLILHCLQQHTNSSNLRAAFYKDRSLIRTQTTDDQMTIPTVSKSHEGFYYCKLPERSASPKSWIAVTESQTEYQISVFKRISSVFAALPYLLLSIILGVKWHRANDRMKSTLNM